MLICQQEIADTVMWKFTHPIFGFGPDIMENLSSIGYSGKDKSGKHHTIVDYLNSLKIGTFSTVRIRSDNGEFSETFVIAMARKEPLKKKAP